MKASIELGDSFKLLDNYKDNYFTSCITDPQYGLSKILDMETYLRLFLVDIENYNPNKIDRDKFKNIVGNHGFMNMEWDNMIPLPSHWKKLYNKMMPGSNLLVFTSPKTFDLVSVSLKLAGFKMKDTIMWVYATGMTHGQKIDGMIDRKYGGDNNISSDFKGYGTDLKPAHEPILCFMKPNDDSYAKNAKNHGISGLNIDKTRVGDKQRYPSNLIIHDSGLIEEYFPYTKSGKMKSSHNRSTDGSNRGIYGKYSKDHPLKETYGDEGSSSRFFKKICYYKKPSRKERDMGLDGGENTHITIKPISLLEYLVDLVTQPNNNVIIDPFMGSGTTGIACKNRNIDFVGMEIVEEYFKIANRINNI